MTGRLSRTLPFVWVTWFRDDTQPSRYGQPSAGPQFCDGADWDIDRPKSSVHVPGRVAQLRTASGLTPVPVSR